VGSVHIFLKTDSQ